MVTMQLSALDAVILREVVRTYDDIVGGRGLQWLGDDALVRVRETLQRTNAHEWRFGSKLSAGSKLWVRIARYGATDADTRIRFAFDANLDPQYAPPNAVARATELEQAFEAAVAALLRDRGYAVE